jgi:hypothetical protein
VLREDQRAVLKRLGPLTTLRDEKDLERLGRPPYNYALLTHRFTSIEGLGLTVLNQGDTPRPGVPNLIWYKPRDGARSSEPERPDFPYEFSGWGYGIQYTPGKLPGLMPCMGDKDWLIHERGVHPISDGGFIAMPPAESYYGEAQGFYTDPPAMQPVLGWAHPRGWALHIWLNGTDVPDVAVVDETEPAAGVEVEHGSGFYFPEKPKGD